MNKIQAIVLVLTVLLLPGCKKNSVPELGWTRTYGGSGGDAGYSVRQTSEGGYIVAGVTGSYGAGDNGLWLVKTDTCGDTVWTRTYGGTDCGKGGCVQQTQDGGYVIVGTTMCGAPGTGVWLVKADGLGRREWARTFGDCAQGNAVQQTRDTGYIVTGWVADADNYDVWLIKTDANGTAVWARTYGGSREDMGYAVRQTADGGYVVAGSTMSYGAGVRDVWLVRTGANGDTLWTRTFGGTSADWAQSVQQTQDGGFIVAGSTFSYRADGSDFWLVKTDSAGSRVWDRIYGGSGLNYGCSVQQTVDGGYVVAGRTEPHRTSSFDVWLIRTDTCGGTIWTRAFGGSRDDMGWSVQQTRDGGYIIAGSTESFGAGGSDLWLLRTDAEGR